MECLEKETKGREKERDCASLSSHLQRVDPKEATATRKSDHTTAAVPLEIIQDNKLIQVGTSWTSQGGVVGTPLETMTIAPGGDERGMETPYELQNQRRRDALCISQGAVLFVRCLSASLCGDDSVADDDNYTQETSCYTLEQGVDDHKSESTVRMLSPDPECHVSSEENDKRILIFLTGMISSVALFLLALQMAHVLAGTSVWIPALGVMASILFAVGGLPSGRRRRAKWIHLLPACVCQLLSWCLLALQLSK